MEDPPTIELGRNGKERYKYKALSKVSPIQWITTFLVNFPKSSFCCSVVFLFFLLFILFAAVALGAFTLSPDALLEDRSDRAYISNNALSIARRESTNEYDNELRINSREYFPMIIIFKSLKGDQVFTQRNIQNMREIEQHILNKKHYQKYCYRGISSDSCEDPISVLSYFYPERLADGTLIYNGKGETIVHDIHAVLELMAQKEGIFQYSGAFVEDDFDDDLESSITRIIFNFAMPFDGKDLADDEDFIDMKDDIYDFQSGLEEYLSDASDSHMRILYLAAGLNFVEVQKLLYTDLALAIISIILIFAFMVFQTGSLWLSIFGIFQIIFAFPCAILTYYFLFNIPYFGAIHMLGVFVVLGIGADDTFIFIDTFKQSRRLKTTLQQRMYWTYKRAGKAMLVTSATTISALIITALVTPFVALQTFGIFAALLVFWDYVLVMTFYPCVVILYAKWFEFKSILCCVNNSMYSSCLPESSSEWGAWRNKNSFTRFVTCQSADYDLIEQELLADGSGSEDSDTPKVQSMKSSRFANKLLRLYYGKLVLHKWLRFPLLFFFLLVVALIIVGASFTAPADEAVEFVSDGTNLADAISYNSDFATGNENHLQVTIVWGIKNLDVSEGYSYDELRPGDVEYDKKFDPSSVAAQNLVLNVCKRAKDFDNDMKIVDDDEDDATVKCYQEDFEKWLRVQYPNQQLPVTGFLYFQYLREFVNSGENFNRYNDVIGFVDDRLSFVSVQFNTTQDPDISYRRGYSHRDAWWDYVDDLNDVAPTGMQSARAVCGLWQWWNVQELLFQQALLGMGISLLVAFLCVTLFTMNIIVSAFAIISIGCVVATVLCLLVVFGWQLGAMEAIASIMVVGLSVDYSVHLAHAYVECKSKTRWTRIRFAVDAVGISIISGGITTILACVVLLFAVVVFLQRFGILIICIIFFSLFFSFGLFVSLLSVFGPQGKKGDLSVFIKPVSRRVASVIDYAIASCFRIS